MAPVGTGKTSALAWRAANAIQHGVAARSVLCLSFTNKASRQMRERAAAVLGEDASRVTARTFHSLCALILRADGGELGLDSDFLVFDDEDARTTACEIAVSMGVLAEKRERLGFFLSNALQEIRLAPFGSHGERNQEQLFEDIRDKSAPPGFRAPATFRFAKLHADYVHALRESHAIDFADLVIGVNRLWQESAASLKRWQQRFQWIQVDEVQDTNVSEYRILRAIAESHKHLSFFGDIDQTIYEWRGSAPGEILNSYRKEFAPVREILLTENYRSTRAILRACSGVVHALEGSVTEEIVTQNEGEGEAVTLQGCATLKDEAEWIAATIERIRLSDKILYSDVAVLVRTNFNARDLSEHFQHLKLPHLPVENVKFFERMEVKDAMAHLRLLLNLNDTPSILRFLDRPSKGVGPAVLKELRGEARTAGLNLGDLLRTTSFDWGEPFAPLIEAWRNGSLVVFDFETTGLDCSQDEICEIAATRRGPQGTSAGETRFHAYIRTECKVGESSQIHGYTDEFLAEHGRPASVVIPEFLEFLGSSVLTGHNINGFDVYFLRSAMRKLELAQIRPLCFDTLEITRRVFRSLKRYSLSALCIEFGICLDHAHEAHADVEANADLINVLCKRLDETAGARRTAVRNNAPRFESLARKLEHWRERMAVERPDELLTRILDESGLAEHYQKDPNERKRLEYLKQLVAFCMELDDPLLPSEMAYREVVENVTLATDLDRQANREDKLSILTVHQAKGLEFPVVFVAMATDENFPSARSKREGRLDEEHRLFYVAVSRAKQRLYLSWFEKDSRGNRASSSRYIAHVRKTLMP